MEEVKREAKVVDLVGEALQETRTLKSQEVVVRSVPMLERMEEQGPTSGQMLEKVE